MPSLDRYRNRHGEVWLNIASSSYVLPDFANLDNHPFLRVSRLPRTITALFKRHAPAIDSFREARHRVTLIKHDCRKRLPLPDASADHILCSHFLEHVYPAEAREILADFRRVLKPGGTAHIIVPDLAIFASAYASTKDADAFVTDTLLSTPERGSLRYRLLEALGAFGLQHRWMYDARSIAALVQSAGFEIINDVTTPSSAYRSGDGQSAHVTARKPR